MHPREGWSEDGPGRPGLSRRSFLRTSAGAGLLAGGLGPLLAACSSGGAAAGASGVSTIPLPRPNNPVTWPLFKDNAAIKSGLQPEQGTLKIYNWVAYINQQCLKDFAKKYNVPVPQVTTFNNTDEAMAKLRSGQVSFDVFVPTIDLMGQLVEGKLIQPINHSYIPNISQAWSDFTNPFYDGKWRYTVPYTIYTTGIAWRKDKVAENPYTMANPWSMLWQPKYKGKVAILDDAREGISLGLMKNGIYNLNTSNPSQINASGQSLVDLAHLTNVHIDNNDYTEVPAGQIWIHHSWSGDMATAASYMPKGVPVDVVGYWFPPDGRGPVGNDLLSRPQRRAEPGARPPVHELHARPEQWADELHLHRVHAAAQRDHAAAPGPGEAAAEIPDVHHGPPLRLPAGGHGAADPGDHERPVGAGMAASEERLGGQA